MTNLEDEVVTVIKREKVFKRILNHQLFDIFVFMIILFTKMWILGDFILYGRQEFVLSFSAKILTVISLLIIGLTSYYMSRRNRYIYLLVWDVFLSLFLFLCVIYYKQFGDFPSLTMLSLLSQLSDVKESVISLLSINDFWLFVSPVVALIVFFLIRKKLSVKKRFYLISHMFIFVFIFFFVVGISGIATMELSGDYEKRNASRLVAVKVGFINYLALDVTSFIQSNLFEVKIDEQRENEIREMLKTNQTNIKDGDYYGIFKDKNVLFVQLESYSSFLLDRKIGEHEITPNLNKLVSSSYYVDNFYTEIAGGHSSDAELASLTSLYPLDEKSAFVMNGNNKYISLISKFRDEGYHTFSAHAHRGDFWNRSVMHSNLGFEQTWFKDAFVQDDVIGIGISDISFMKQTVEKILNVESPFVGYLITLESHSPFYVPEDRKELKLGNLEGTKIGHYLHSIHHTDKAIKELIDGLKENGLYEDTVIVMYGDHDVEYMNSEIEKLFPVNPGEEIFLKQVPFLIHDPSGNLQGRVDNIMGHVDIAPTIMHLWGLESENAQFFLGSNVFSSNRRDYIRIFQGHIVTNNYALQNMNNTIEGLKAFDSKTHKEIAVTEEMKKTFVQVQENYKMSNDIIRADLIERIQSSQ